MQTTSANSVRESAFTAIPRIPRSACRFCRATCIAFPEFRRLSAQGRMQPETIVVLLDERLNVGAQVIEIAILVGVDFFSLECFHEALATGVGLSRQLRLMRTN